MTQTTNPQATFWRENSAFFLIALAIFVYQNLLGPLFSTLLTGLWQAWVAIPSFLGIGLGIWLVNVCNISAGFVQRWVYRGIFYSFLAVFLLLVFFERSVDQSLLQLALQKNPLIIEQIMGAAMFDKVIALLSLVMLPFVIFGMALGGRFSQSQKALSAYRIELAGLLLGTLLCIWLLEGQSLQMVILGVVVLSLLGLLLSEKWNFKNSLGASLKLAAPVILFLIFATSPQNWTPQRDLHLVARDFMQQAQVQEMGEQWKSFSKVQFLRLHYTNADLQRIAVGDGTGIARVFSYDESFSRVHPLVTTQLASLEKPKKALILFAGAGAELLSLHQALGTQVESWGVEINPSLVDLANKYGDLNFDKFSSKYQSHLVFSDNRKFLETSSEKFDSIVFSWSGATVANFSGAILHTTQYSFTIEALKAALRHLQKNGNLIVMGGNKLNLLMNLKQLEAEGVVSDLPAKILIFDEQQMTSWTRSWDQFILIFKNGSWTESAIAETIKAVEPNYQLVLKPGAALRDDFKHHLQLLQSSDSQNFAQKLWQSDRIFPQTVSDDHPFAYRNFPSLFVNKPGSWSSLIVDAYLHPQFQFFDGAVWMLTLSLVFLLISWQTGKGKPSSDFFVFLTWAPLGAACSLFFLYKGLLFVGQPTWAFLAVQGGSQAGNLLALKAAERFKNSKLRWAALAIGILGLMFAVWALTQDGFSPFVFQLSPTVTVIWLVLLTGLINCALAFFFLGNLLKIAEKDSKIFGFYWGFEVIFTGTASLLGAFLIEEASLSVCVFAFVVFSMAVLLLAQSLTHLSGRLGRFLSGK